MDISVIVPFYNAGRFIEACIQGLEAQTYGGNYEIIMVDNNSNDGSADIVRRHPNIRLMTEATQGAYAARNRGLLNASGAIVAFTDPDCVPEPTWLEHIAAELQLPEAHIVLGRRLAASDSTVPSLLMSYEHAKDEFVFSSDVAELYYGHTNNMAVRQETLEELGPFQETQRGADTVFVRRAVERYSCAAVRYCPAACVRHLEVDRLLAYYRKAFIHGLSRHFCGEAPRTRPLTNAERLLLFRRLLTSAEQSWAQAVLLFVLLVGGLVAWELGSWSGALAGPLTVPMRHHGMPDRGRTNAGEE